MKPWLSDILACPIDKHFPLELIIFTFETSEQFFRELLEVYDKKDITSIKKDGIIKIEQEDGELLLKDDIVIEISKFDKYINLVLSSVKEVDNIQDNSSYKLSKRCIQIIQNEIKQKIKTISNNFMNKDIDNILPELYLLNKFKAEVEIETGILFCSECNRWFPIIETIPQMLPDEYRDEEADVLFLKTNKDLLNTT
ncbi:MAG: Trm112 family protein, partial [Promethearchaeota archaeon]